MKSWTTTKIILDRDKNELYRFTSEETTSDTNGNVLDETEYDETGSVACRRIYRYFPDGAVKEYVAYDPLDQLIERHEYIENEVGEINEVVFEYSDGHKVVKKFKRNELGLADTVVLYDENNLITGYEIYVFNDDGEVLERIESDSENVELLRHTHTYDENGYVSSEEKFVEGVLTEVTHYANDMDGRVIRKQTNNKTERITVVDEYAYDDSGNMIHNKSFQNGALVFENMCTYDKNRHLLSEEFFEIDYWEKRVTRHERLLHVPNE